MVHYLIYVNPKKTEALVSWFKITMCNPIKKLYEEIAKISRDDVAFDAEVRKPGFIAMMIGHDEYTRLQDYFEDSDYQNKRINREAVIIEYLTRIGDSPRNRFSPATQSVEDIITIVADIIEEKCF